MNSSYLVLFLGLAKKLGKVPFSNVVKQSTGFDVIPINLQDAPDKVLVDTLDKILSF